MKIIGPRRIDAGHSEMLIRQHPSTAAAQAYLGASAERGAPVMEVSFGFFPV